MNINNFEQSFSSAVLGRGRRYFRSGKVQFLEKASAEGMEEWYALVNGSGDEYEVEVNLLANGGIEHYACDCPYNWGGPCKHIAAVLFKIREEKSRNKMEPSASGPAPQGRSVDELMKAYEELSKTEQRLLKIAAILWEPVSQTKLIEIFNAAKFRGRQKNVYPADVKPLLKKLVHEGFLAVTFQQYECPKDFADALCGRYFSTDPEFPEVIFPIRHASPSNLYWYHASAHNRLFRDMRIGRYAGDTVLFQRNFFALIQLDRERFSQSKLIEYWLDKDFNADRLASFPAGVRSFLLSQRLTMDTFSLSSLDNGFFQYTLDNIAQLPGEGRPLLARLLVQLNILRGDWRQVGKLAGHFDEVSQFVFPGIGHLLQGRYAEALDTFDKAQRLARKVSGNKKEGLSGLGGIFHILAQLHPQDTRLYKNAHNTAQHAIRQPNGYQDIYHYLDAVLFFLENNKPLAERMLLEEPQFPISCFFWYLCQFWVSESLVDIGKVERYRGQLAADGYAWMAAEMNALLGALGHPTDGYPLPESKPLIHLLPRIEEWENAIKVLLELGGKAPASVEPGSRIAWLVDFEKGWAQARHQTIGKNGSWTKGRVVAFDRLMRGEVEGLTPQDESFIRTVRHAWGSEIIVDGKEENWKPLVGHPLLFLRKSPATAVQLVEAKPTLIAKRTHEGYQMHFTHNAQAEGAKVEKESPTRYLFIEVTEQMARIARAFNGKSLRVPQHAEAQLREALSGLARLVPVQSAFEDENLPTVQADSRICVHLLPVGDGFHVELYVKPFREIPPYVKPAEGEAFVIGLMNGQRTVANRDLEAEKKNRNALREQVPVLKNSRPHGGAWQLEDAESCLQLLLELRPLLEAEAIILEWPKGEKMRIDSVAGFDQFRLSVSDGSQWFELNGELKVDEETVLTLQELLALSEQQSQFVEISPGKFLALASEFRQRLKGINGLISATKKNGILQIHPLAAPAIEPFTEAVKDLEVSRKFRESKERLEQAFAQKYRLPKNFNASLRPYQREGFLWLQRCAAWGVGACLADDMGLGKTVQALALLTARAKLGPALVVAPASVCRNWVAETARFAPALTPILFSESERENAIKKARKGQLLIVTYDLMAREEEIFTQKEWATVILDEAQAIKNRATKRSETAMGLNAGFKIAMTGTPLENHLGELWNLFQFLNPGLLGSIGQFNERFALPIEKYQDANRREQLRRLVHPFILRRRKDEVLKDLPEKTEITLTVELPPEERAFYEALRRNAIEKLDTTAGDEQAGQQHLRILAEIMRLRRAACHPALADGGATFTRSAKLELFSEIVDELLDNGHKALVFSQFVDHLKILEKHLKSKKISYQYLDGSTPGKKRQAAIEAFQAGKGDIFLISLKAGGTGLNLTAADYVIHTDPWWNPAVEDQATDRAHRIGQQRPVTAYRLVAEQTIEEKILQLHAKKRDLADSLLAGADVSAKLSADELMGLLKEGTSG